MRVLIYKRTHTGDPDESGRFGHECCMGQVRGRDFDAVIGVGGIGQKPIQYGIDRRITWIGIGPRVVGVARDGYPILAFEQFYLRDQKGPLLRDKARNLAKRMFAEYGPRTLMVESDSDNEIETILKIAKNAPRSPALLRNTSKPKRCKRRQEKKRC